MSMEMNPSAINSYLLVMSPLLLNVEVAMKSFLLRTLVAFKAARKLRWLSGDSRRRTGLTVLC